MARQPRRSASVLTRKSRTRSVHSPATLSISSRFLPLVTLALTILVGISRAQSNLDSDLLRTTPVGTPKFGDRLQPRYRQIARLNNSASSVTIVTSANASRPPSASHRLPPLALAPEVTTAVENEFAQVVRQQETMRRNDDNVDEPPLPIESSDNDLAAELPPPPPPQPSAESLNISKADRLIEMSTEFFIVPSSTTTTTQRPATTTTKFAADSKNHLQPRPVLILAPKSPSHSSGNTSSGPVTPPSVVSTHLPNGLRKEPWVVPVLVLASLTMIMMAAFEIFVLFKAWRTSPSRRHLFLGQMLLLGLFACAGLGAIITAQPTVLSCGAIRFGAGVAYALVFAALLVKCVFLISLNGGVYLPAPYQGLLLLFAVLIQVAIGTQWLMTQPPDIYTMTVPFGGGVGGATSAGTSLAGGVGKLSSMLITSGDITRGGALGGVGGTAMIPLCKTQFSELLLSLIYIVFLIVFVAVLAIKSRGIRDNYRESTYIGLAIGGAIPIWLGWMLCGLAVADRHKDACIAFGLVATSATVFLVMFMPKGRQLAAMGKEGLYVEDREEQFSSLSRAGSGYSPSFFHFKPIKYGVMGPVPNSTSNTANGNSAKHTATMNGGGGLFIRPDETNLYTTLEPTLSSNPNVYFQRSGGVHPGMMY